MKPSRVLIIDIIAAVVYIMAANPGVTGLAIHEWISLGTFVVFIVHGAQHYDWAIETFRKIKERPASVRTARLILDILTIASFMVVTVSGLMVSRFILPLLGMVAPGYFFWNPLHSISAKVLLALLVIHIVINAGRVWALLKARNKNLQEQEQEQGQREDDKLLG